MKEDLFADYMNEPELEVSEECLRKYGQRPNGTTKKVALATLWVAGIVGSCAAAVAFDQLCCKAAEKCADNLEDLLLDSKKEVNNE